MVFAFGDSRAEWLRDALLLFKDCGFDDSCLPAEDPADSEPEVVRSTLTTGKARKSFEDVQELDQLRNKSSKICWRPRKITQFCENQWKFLAPVFSTRKHNYDVRSMAILPFISKYFEVGQGSFGRVYKYEIHPDHITDPLRPEPCPTVFAVKEILPSDKEDRRKVAVHWMSEANALAKMNELNQNHIVRFITAFRRYDKHEEEHYLMFEWADGGNLQNLWKEMTQPNLTPSLVKAVLGQLRGLARALNAAHYPTNVGGGVCRHGDLKPANILWFRGGGEIGTLKIGDWGEAKIQNQFTELRPNRTTAQYGTVRYEAPEARTGLDPAFIGQPRMRRSRLYDIWAMGCITLEFLIWIMYGTEALNEFNRRFENSSFYEWKTEHGQRVTKVHEIAIQYMDRLALDPVCQVGTTALGDLLEIVRTGLLVVALPQRLGRDVNSERFGLSTEKSRVALSSAQATEEPLVKSDEAAPLVRTSSEPAEQHGIEINIVPAASEDTNTLQEAEPVQRGPVGKNVTTRLLASELVQRLENILPADDGDEGESQDDDGKLFVDDDDSYWLPDEPRLPRTILPHRPMPLRPANHSEYQTDATAPTSIHRIISDEFTQLDDEWDYIIDNRFARTLMSAVKTNDLSYGRPTHLSSKLCSECRILLDGLSRPAYSIVYKVPQLEYRATSQICDLCVTLWRTCRRFNGRSYPTAQFDKRGSFVTINGRGYPALAIVQTTGKSTTFLVTMSAKDIQIASPWLLEAGSATYYETLRQWLRQCDEEHSQGCCGSSKKRGFQVRLSPQRLPTRLIEVGATDDKEVRLREMEANDIGQWIALSHQWGLAPHFSTTRLNLEDHLKGIKVENLPATFRDAVSVTRALHCRYLWIDSICIIQGPDGDFNEEARRMEEVYSGAHCVLAASCATSHLSGFLKPRHERNYTGLLRERETPLYVCDMIDDFQSHVLNGGLNSRGWVMQEHALARRTIFFTEYQTYWECGEGVRCETMTKMKNNLAAFQGDPNFPQILIDAPQGERIVRLQELYRTYSRLGLSNNFDRPMAIDGLQRRLLRTLNAKGGYGVFDEGESKGLLRRSLLWCRGAGTASLGRIRFPIGTAISQVPSWSWMAYTGAIDYLSVGFGQLDWEDVRSPWSADPNAAIRTDLVDGKPSLTAVAYGYDAVTSFDGERLLRILDTPGGSRQEKIFCVVLGKQKEYVSLDQRIHYLLYIAQVKTTTRDGNRMFERVGAGWLPGRCIDKQGFEVSIY
ncbi:hypothetical protein K491DRAFT_602167 [Lophiostoma macrostomum CBS 122681]|uniref:Protein kinase domain-containing protein n=1 Tax=Lophiostoma macrostomum CBS 122681 TaxID=1314788 RepID=A0A6A6T1K4_9PLEO|nr:hypothetical protein K491DRAFT_602167 [Lophiostoma macrostomum CBS 122681]